ncbi:hypothetical protein E1A91_A04G047300v1 [Gossypium mustelinum]|uniref:Uncharacterized protein n=2 Tax=Gossypium TaxID=3633 RepID=A0A5J5W281_GOSBA|nr:hypothetical protein ES319_A04G042500v1 [Gossypium barbadense]TYJ39159.1 hypothetical protein E1A91_A04G047300v1 [Gossypium mustelinum]
MGSSGVLRAHAASDNRCYAKRVLSALFLNESTDRTLVAYSIARKKGRTLRLFVPHRGHWPNPQGFDDLQIGERTPERTQTVNRRCQTTFRGVWSGNDRDVVAEHAWGGQWFGSSMLGG